MDNDSSYLFPVLHGSQPAMGLLNKNGFRLRKPHANVYAFAPIFYGTMREDATGTFIEGHFGMNPVIKGFLILWSVLFFGSIFFSDGLPAFLFLLAPFAGLMLLIQFFVYNDRRCLLEFLEGTLKASRVYANTAEL